MRVYRITLEPYSRKLFASGRRARWNSKGTYMIYSAATRSLACLENVVHRSGEGLNAVFRTMIIDIPEDILIKEIKPSQLTVDWQSYINQQKTRKIGDQWVRSNESSVLKVPSAIVKEEFNYLINPSHLDFDKIRLLRTDEFVFDSRLV